MKINHDQTKQKILNICEILRTQARTANEFKTAQDNVLSDETLSQSYQNSRIEELRNTYIAAYYETKEKINAILEEILTIEAENEKILELDVPEFANTIAVINAAQGGLPPEVMEGIKLNFAGQYRALLAIKAVFESYDIDLKPYGYDEYTVSAQFSIMNLFNYVSNIEQSETATFMSLQKVFSEVIRFGEVRGIHFTDSEKTFAIEPEMREALTRQAMGL